MQSPIATIGVLLRRGANPAALDALRQVCSEEGVQATIVNIKQTLSPNLDAIVALGGDGTVLRALLLATESPVLGINFGSVGFLTAGERTDLRRLLKKLFSGDWILSQRLLLECFAPSLGITQGREAFNEVVMRTTSHMMTVEVVVNETSIRTIRGDGVLVSTPTGSTGYLLATGGPIVMPEADCFVLMAINEYNFTSRPLVLPSNAKIALRVGSLPDPKKAYLQMDGQDIGNLQVDDVITLRRASRLAKLIFFEKNFFFQNLATRLSWTTLA